MRTHGFEYISCYLILVRGTSFNIYKTTRLVNTISDVSKLSYIYSLFNTSMFKQKTLTDTLVLSNRQIQHLTKRSLIIKLNSPGYIINPLIVPFLDKLDQDYKKILQRKKII